MALAFLLVQRLARLKKGGNLNFESGSISTESENGSDNFVDSPIAVGC
jgi:hypothetical protein